MLCIESMILTFWLIHHVVNVNGVNGFTVEQAVVEYTHHFILFDAIQVVKAVKK